MAKTTVKKIAPQKKVCLGCNRELALTNFYTANDILYPQDSKFHLCKACIEQIVERNGEKGFMMVLRAMNKPLIVEIYNGNYKEYLKNVNSLHQYKGMTYDDSTVEVLDEGETLLPDEDEYEIEVTAEVRRRWRGFKDEEILELEDKFQELAMGYECTTPIQQNLYKNIAITQYKANSAAINGNMTEYDKLMKTLSTLMNDASIKPVQEMGADKTGLSSFGEFIKMIENEEPIPEPAENLKDVDGIRQYIGKWFVGHMKKIFGLNDDNEIDETMLIEQKDGEQNG